MILRIDVNQSDWWKSNVEKLDIDKFENVPSRLSTLKIKVDKFDIGKLETALLDLSKLSNVVKMMSLKRLNIMSYLKELIILMPLILVILLKSWLSHKNQWNWK